MKIRDFIISAFVVVVMGCPSFAQVLISNNFDGDDTNDLGGALGIVSNGLEDNDATVPATGQLLFQDVDNSNPAVGFTSSAAVDFSSFDGFTVEWVVASGFSTADIRSNGWFFGVQDAVGMQGVGDTLWNNVPNAVGVTLLRGGGGAGTTNADFAEAFGGVAFTPLGILDNLAVVEDGFTISVTLNSDNTWSVSSVGLDNGAGELSGSGTLATGTSYADFSDNLFASTSFQINTQGGGGVGAPGVDSGAQYTSLTVTGFQSQVLRCDVNLDGAVTFLDIAPFIAVLSTGGTQAEADCNEDGEVTFLDIAPFIAALANAG